MRYRNHIFIAVALSIAPILAPSPFTSLLAHEGEGESVDEVIVYGRAQSLVGTALSASEGLVGYSDLELQPLLRVGELVEVVPGMVATQHSGTGKANQYFLRGFNLDHGTDFSASLDGVPINMRTHGHGQGYLDLNFLIPELVETVTYRKGVHHTDAGDFSSAGSVEFRYYDELDKNVVGLTVGDYDHLRGVAAGSFDAGAGTATVAVDVTGYSGPWQIDEALEQVRAYAAYARRFGETTAKLSFMAYSSDWNATDQVPLRAVQSGLIDTPGFIDPDLGGRTDRYALTGTAEFENWSATLYAIDYDFGLLSNFTYLLEDPENGDQFEQTDRRRIYGAVVKGHRHLSDDRAVTLSWGAGLRHDDIDEVGLFPTRNGQRTGVVRQDSVMESSAGVYADIGFAIGERFRSSLGARADHLRWDVDARESVNGGSGDDTILSPKLSAAYEISPAVEIYANWGRGYHSTDVRGVTITTDPVSGEPAERVEALVASDGAEIGLRIDAGNGFNATLTGFWLALDSELVFVGDGGATEPNDGSSRQGIELAGFWQATDWLAANFAYTFVDAEFDNVPSDSREIPGAVDTTFSLGLNAAWQNRLFASVRARYLGEAPLIEDGSVQSDDSLLLNVSLGYRWGQAELRLDAFNLLDSGDDDIAYYYASRLDGEPADGVEDIHFHPLEPRALRLSLSYHWR